MGNPGKGVKGMNLADMGDCSLLGRVFLTIKKL
jgi:hypothetical protein